MTVLVSLCGKINARHPGRLTGLEESVLIAVILAPVGIGWDISWTTWASDYSRYVQSEAPIGKTFWSYFFGMLVATLWLGILGALTATMNLEKPETWRPR